MTRLARAAWPLWAAGILLAITSVFSTFQVTIAIQVLLVATAALGYNLMFGTAGQISMGSAAFLATGTFTATGISIGLHWPAIVAIIGASLMSCLLAIVIGVPSLRLSSHYLLFSTLALHFIVLYFFVRLQGPRPGWSLPAAGLGFLTESPRGWLVLATMVFFATAWVVRNLQIHRPGQIWTAIRESPSGAAMMGVNVAVWRLIVVGFSAALFGLVGALQAFYLRNVSVEAFNFDLVIQYIAVVFIGGLGSILGSAIGSFVIVGVPYLVASVIESPLVMDRFPQLQRQQFSVIELIYGVLLVATLLFEPGGLAVALERLGGWVRVLVSGPSSFKRLAKPAPGEPVTSGGTTKVTALEKAAGESHGSGSGSGLRIRELSVAYGFASPAIRGVSFDVPTGSVVTLIGPNGAGKTTTLRAVAAFSARERVQISANAITWQGRNILRLSSPRIARTGVCLVPERDKVFRTLSVSANIAVRLPRGARRHEVLEEIDRAFPALKSLKARSAGMLSGGERQMLALATALATRPGLLLIDEATLGLAPVAVRQLVDTLKLLKAMGVTILLAEQNVRLALEVSDYLYALSNGRITEGGPVSEWDESRLRNAYLGVSEADEVV